MKEIKKMSMLHGVLLFSHSGHTTLDDSAAPGAGVFTLDQLWAFLMTL